QDQGRLCRRALSEVMLALNAGNVDRAQAVITADDEVDALYLRVEEDVETLLARQSPVAIDLRLVLAMIHINQHLERIGDQCVNIAKLVQLLDGSTLPSEVAAELTLMGDQAGVMVQQAMESFGARDVPRAEQLVEMDQVINRAHHGLSQRITRAEAAGSDPQAGLRAIVIGRCLERVGDNAVDI